MKKILAVSALTLVFAAACTFGVLFAAQSAVANTGSGYSFAIDAAVLKKGSTGSEVKKVQQKLKNWGLLFGLRGRDLRFPDQKSGRIFPA